MQQEIDENAIHNLINKEFQNLDPRVKNKIEPIHDQIDFYYNSFNVCLGKQGTGKTSFMMYELLKLVQVENLYDSILYISNTLSDITFNKLKVYLSQKIPIYHCTFEQSIKTLGEYFDKFKDGINHIFIIIEDATFLLLKDNPIWFGWICSLRHLRATVWVNLHIWKSLSPALKSQIACTYVLKGYSRENMLYVYKQSSVSMDFGSFYAIYTILKPRQVLAINNITNELEILN